MQIFFKTSTGVVLTVDVELSDTIKMVKNKLLEKSGVVPEQQILVAMNQPSRALENERTVESYQIRAESTLQLIYAHIGDGKAESSQKTTVTISSPEGGARCTSYFRVTVREVLPFHTKPHEFMQVRGGNGQLIDGKYQINFQQGLISIIFDPDSLLTPGQPVQVHLNKNVVYLGHRHSEAIQHFNPPTITTFQIPDATNNRVKK